MEKADANNSIVSESEQQSLTATAESEKVEVKDPAEKKSGLFNVFKKRKN